MNEEGGSLRKLTLSDITLHTRIPQGATREVDVNCDTEFMMATIHEIGKSIRNKMKWVPKWNPIHLFIDNTGGHGTNEGKDKYEKMLANKYNIILKWQVLTSPEAHG